MEEAIKIANLTKRFDGVAAVDDLSLVVEKGKITSIIGPNGSGKTTLVNVLSGLVPFEKGSIFVHNTRLRKIDSAGIVTYGLTRTFQEVQLFNQMEVLDNILLTLTERSVFEALFEKHKAYHIERAEELLKKVGLWEKRNAFAGELSYGQRKLLEVARVLAMQANVYLFDEPFAGLFPEIMKVIVKILQELRTESKTVVLIEHNMDLIRELSDHVIVLDGGRLLAEGKPDDVLKKKEVMEAYLGE